MKKRAVVSERGTITIPESIRKIANIHPGDLIEFEPHKDDIILRRLLVTRAEEEKFMSDDEWDKFEKMVKQQLRSGEYAGYTDFEKAKEHSRKLRKQVSVPSARTFKNQHISLCYDTLDR